MSALALRVDQWYVDLTPGHEGLPAEGQFFKVLRVHAETLEVVDLYGVVRTVNRLLFEATMQLAGRVPMTRRVAPIVK